MFERIDKEADGEVYVKEVTDFLRVLDDNLEQSDEVLETNQNDEHENSLSLRSMNCLHITKEKPVKFLTSKNLL